MMRSVTLWVAAVTISNVALDDEDFDETARITKEEGKRLKKKMYPDL